MRFFLGTHQADWLASSDVPLFVSRRRLAGMRTLPRARGAWALDSGGFTELSMHGAWTVGARAYVAEVRRFRDDIGGMEWAAPQDWMCEPVILAKTGRTVEDHQALTIANFVELQALAPEVPWTPVLQGWSLGDYWRHLEAYDRAGINLRSAPIVGVGTVCRRQGMGQASAILASLHAEGLRLHGFGFKVGGLRASRAHLASADSLAWSLNARKSPPLPGCAHASCSSCKLWAMQWRDDLLQSMAAQSEREAA